MAERNVEYERIVRENYATMTGGEIKRRFGILPTTVNAIARRLGVKHSAEVWERLLERRRIQIRKNSEGKSAMIGRKVHLRHHIDEIRVMSGLPQLSKRRIRKIPCRIYKAKWNCVHKYGYYECEGDLYTVLYDENTQRKPKLEALYEERYGLKFEKI